MRGLSKPIQKLTTKVKRKRYKEEKNPSKLCSGRDYAWQDGPLTEEKKKQRKKKQKHQGNPGDKKEEEAEAKRDTSEGREEEAGMLNPRISSDS